MRGRRASGLVLSGRQSPVSYKNLVANGDFSNGTTGWLGSYSTRSVTDGIMTLTGTGTDYPLMYSSTGNKVIGSKYYARIKARVTNSVCVKIYSKIGNGEGIIKLAPTINEWYDLGAICTALTTTPLAIFGHTYSDVATAVGKAMEIQQTMVVDLTALFGPGNEPTLAWCNANLPFTATQAIALAMPANLSDRSRFGNHGAFTGATWVQLSTGAWVMDFTSAENLVTIPAAASINDMPEFTWCGWVKYIGDGGLSAGRLFDKTTNLLMVINAGANGYLDFRQTFSTTGGSWTTGSATMPINIWEYVEISYSKLSSTYNPIICINGISKTVTRTTPPVGTFSTDVANNMTFGNRVGSGRYLNGYMSAPKIYNYLRTEAQALLAYNAEKYLYGL